MSKVALFMSSKPRRVVLCCTVVSESIDVYIMMQQFCAPNGLLTSALLTYS